MYKTKYFFLQTGKETWLLSECMPFVTPPMKHLQSILIQVKNYWTVLVQS